MGFDLIPTSARKLKKFMKCKARISLPLIYHRRSWHLFSPFAITNFKLHLFSLIVIKMSSIISTVCQLHINLIQFLHHCIPNTVLAAIMHNALTSRPHYQRFSISNRSKTNSVDSAIGP